MIVMPSNNTGSEVRALHERHPGRLAMLVSPGGWRAPYGEFAIDNGRFAVWARGKQWSEQDFLSLIERAMEYRHLLRWIVVPDVVEDCEATHREWDAWEPRLRQYGVPLAFAVQDGEKAENVPDGAEVIFVGGTTAWKRRTMYGWCRFFPRVHIARINTERWLWNCDRCGAESCDGTGWTRGDKVQWSGLVRYLRRSNAGLGPLQQRLKFGVTMETHEVLQRVAERANRLRKTAKVLQGKDAEEVLKDAEALEEVCKMAVQATPRP